MFFSKNFLVVDDVANDELHSLPSTLALANAPQRLYGLHRVVFNATCHATGQAQLVENPQLYHVGNCDSNTQCSSISTTRLHHHCEDHSRKLSHPRSCALPSCICLGCGCNHFTMNTIKGSCCVQTPSRKSMTDSINNQQIINADKVPFSQAGMHSFPSCLPPHTLY